MLHTRSLTLDSLHLPGDLKRYYISSCSVSGLQLQCPVPPPPQTTVCEESLYSCIPRLDTSTTTQQSLDRNSCSLSRVPPALYSICFKQRCYQLTVSSRFLLLGIVGPLRQVILFVKLQYECPTMLMFIAVYILSIVHVLTVLKVSSMYFCVQGLSRQFYGLSTCQY